MELMARVQKILGKKIFQDAIIARNGMEVYAEPKKNEPSLGTLHPMTEVEVINTDPADANWSAAVDIAAYVPAGTKAVYGKLRLRSINTTAYWGQVAGDTTPSSPYIYGICGSVAGIDGQVVNGIIYLPSGLNLYWQVQSANVSVIRFSLLGYFI